MRKVQENKEVFKLYAAKQLVCHSDDVNSLLKSDVEEIIVN
jgi:hypothetical protein